MATPLVDTKLQVPARSRSVVARPRPPPAGELLGRLLRATGTGHAVGSLLDVLVLQSQVPHARIASGRNHHPNHQKR